jgi:hypothetical protein
MVAFSARPTNAGKKIRSAAATPIPTTCGPVWEWP